jgi:hypothetical protein
MTEIALCPRIEKGRARSRAPFVPAPAPEMYGLLALLRRPMPLGELRPAAIAAGLSSELVESAFSIATRRGELRIEAGSDGTVLAVRRRP